MQWYQLILANLNISYNDIKNNVYVSGPRQFCAITSPLIARAPYIARVVWYKNAILQQ